MPCNAHVMLLCIFCPCIELNQSTEIAGAGARDQGPFSLCKMGVIIFGVSNLIESKKKNRHKVTRLPQPGGKPAIEQMNRGN